MTKSIHEIMAEDIDPSENNKTPTQQPRRLHDSLQFDASKPNTLRSLISPKIRFPKFRRPTFKVPKINVSFPKTSFLFFWLFVILLSYICIGYFLSILLTIPSRRNIVIAGFTIVSLLPTITGFADYALIKWGYLLSGFLIVGALIFLVKIKFYFIVLAFMSWIGITLIAFIGESLTKKKHKFINVIIILTTPCLLGLGIGWKLWHLVATSLS